MEEKKEKLFKKIRDMERKTLESKKFLDELYKVFIFNKEDDYDEEIKVVKKSIKVFNVFLDERMITALLEILTLEEDKEINAVYHLLPDEEKEIIDLLKGIITSKKRVKDILEGVLKRD